MVKLQSISLLLIILCVNCPLSADDAVTINNGRDFFHHRVLPELVKNKCLMCHAKGYIRPNVTFYEELLRRLAIGDSAENNMVIYKLANMRSFSPDIPNHPGGQRCLTPDFEPCAAIKEWWLMEFGEGK